MFQLQHDAFPIPGLWLAKQPRGRVPGTVITIQQPTPTWREWQRNPNGPAQRAYQVGHRSIDRNDQIEFHNGGGRVAEIPEVRAKIDDLAKSMQRLNVMIADILLQAQEFNSINFK